ncbi:uncharacterized protein TRIADDRAFT_51409 [Trichoplax adhaerens]|uniref:Uncharacterized protein n=1 Tax=Trichoplax adhaerens TaxID=10228 RepID=B3RIX9_TRIAD|nr:hypothetical protein TRIADDRAFT_51409 [Trichoplax adhaerens]EDV29266.1 hypothetical protein TRIADDRAFT_51409 [Trichoplax adhaerens]|eukprot:XP_002108468.1 hypothetical protein TRIADDRAFT_51409 [Trichoplax adhaerens]
MSTKEQFSNLARCQYLTTSASGTTHNIKEIFIGRCYGYIALQNFTLRPGVTCPSLWQEFSRVFVNREPCEVDPTQYSRFLIESSSPVPPNKALFWSGVYDFVSSYVQAVDDVLVISQTFTGFLLDKLTWCGRFKSTPQSEGINYLYCNDSQGCSHRNMLSFWALASREFAKSASGLVRVLLTSDNKTPAFNNQSIFGSIELPNLSPQKVSKVEIMVMHGLNSKPNQIDRCGIGSIKELQNILTSHNFTWSCQDNPKSVLHHLCTKNPNNFHCRLAIDNSTTTNPSKPNQSGLIIGIIIEGVVIALLVAALLGIILRGKPGNFCSSKNGGPGSSRLMDNHE